LPHDSAGSRGWALTYATPSPAPATCAAIRSHPGPRIPIKTDRWSPMQGHLVKAFQDATAVFDSAGHLRVHQLCLDAGGRGAQLAAPAATSSRWTELNKIGERIWNLEREFNLRAGFTAKDDTLPMRAC